MQIAVSEKYARVGSIGALASAVHPDPVVARFAMLWIYAHFVAHSLFFFSRHPVRFAYSSPQVLLWNNPGSFVAAFRFS
jgi:hypothetical protein